MRHLIDITDLTTEEIDELIAVAEDIIAQPEKYQEVCRHKKLATLFFEPSTRTRLSFESAMLSLGGNVLGFSEASSSSATKGETIGDTVRVVSAYCDIIAMRHPKEGAPYAAAKVSGVPIINAGDGGHNHPTQTLTDLLTIHRERGSLNDFTIGFCGDLKFGRTVHSLVNALARYTGIRFVFIAPEELKLPRYLVEDTLEKNGLPYQETTSLEEALPQPGLPLHDPRPARAVLQRGRLYPPEGHLHSRSREAEKRQARHGNPAPAAPCQRDHRGRGRRSPRPLFPAGRQRPVHPHGSHHEDAGPQGVSRRVLL